jgi:hypothetical protein
MFRESRIQNVEHDVDRCDTRIPEITQNKWIDGVKTVARLNILGGNAGAGSLCGPPSCLWHCIQFDWLAGADEFDWNSRICAGVCVGAQINRPSLAPADWTRFRTAGWCEVVGTFLTGTGISAGKARFSSMLQIAGRACFPIQFTNYRPVLTGTEDSGRLPHWTNSRQYQI